jgi:hypothetical protein
LAVFRVVLANMQQLCSVRVRLAAELSVAGVQHLQGQLQQLLGWQLAPSCSVEPSQLSLYAGSRPAKFDEWIVDRQCAMMLRGMR